MAIFWVKSDSVYIEGTVPNFCFILAKKVVNCFFACQAFPSKFACWLLPLFVCREEVILLGGPSMQYWDCANEGKVSLRRWFVQITTLISPPKREKNLCKAKMKLFSPDSLSSSFTCKAAFPNLWWWWKRHPFFPWKNWLRAEELFTLVALSNSEGREKRNITFPITRLIPKSWLKSRVESSRDITICKTNHTNHTQTAQLSTP